MAPALLSVDWQGRRMRSVAFVSILAFGLALTVGMFTVARGDAAQAQEARREAAIGEALDGVQSFVDGIERVLVDTRLFAAEAGYDPDRFAEYGGLLVETNPMLGGVALIDPNGLILSSVGSVGLLAPPVAASTDPRLVGNLRQDEGYLLGLVGGVDGAHQVYVEVWARTSAGSDERAFALVLADGRVLAGNATGGDPVSGPVAGLSIGGVPTDLYLELDADDRIFGFTLPMLLLLGGSSLTFALAMAVDGALRRGTLITGLVAEQSALGRALEDQRVLEDELRRAQQQWDAVLRDSPDVIAVVGDDRSLRLLNREAMLGHPGSALAEEDGLCRLLDVEDQRRFGWLVAVARSTQEQGEVKETAFALRDDEGESRWFALRLTCTETDPRRGPSETIATFTDIHDRWTRRDDPRPAPAPGDLPIEEPADARLERVVESARERRGQSFGDGGADLGVEGPDVGFDEASREVTRAGS